MARDAHQLRSIVLGDEPRAWSELGFQVVAPGGTGAAAVVHLGRTAVELTRTGGGFSGWVVDGISGPIDGVRALAGTHAGEAGPDDTGGTSSQELSPHPNGITSIDHIVVTTGHIGRTATALERTGLECRGERSTTRYGSPMRQRFYWLGDVILELVGPGDGEPCTETPAQVFGLALVSEHLDATLDHLGDLGGTPRDAVQPGRRIAAIRGDRVGVSIPLAVMSPHPG